jgi:uncharacterized protein YijF (DUF1287 family)
MKAPYVAIAIGVVLILSWGCDDKSEPSDQDVSTPAPVSEPSRPPTKSHLVAAAAMDQVGKTTTYDPAYVKLAYPGGDVPIDRGVCTDVVVRALRKLGVDLQVLIHEDMTASFESYPNLWNLKRPDPNIDHRRVPNIATFLRRKGKAIAVNDNAADYLPGDIVVWRFPDGRPHIGIVSNVLIENQTRHKMVHNVGAGACVQDVLFVYKIERHFRYF